MVVVVATDVGVGAVQNRHEVPEASLVRVLHLTSQLSRLHGVCSLHLRQHRSDDSHHRQERPGSVCDADAGDSGHLGPSSTACQAELSRDVHRWRIDPMMLAHMVFSAQFRLIRKCPSKKKARGPHTNTKSKLRFGFFMCWTLDRENFILSLSVFRHISLLL
jgi:hypothetical protein